MEGDRHLPPGGGTVLLDSSLLTGVICFIESQNGFFFYFIKVIRVFLYFKSISSRRMFNNNKTGFLPSAPHPVTVPCSPPQKQPNHCPLLGLLLAFACF